MHRAQNPVEVRQIENILIKLAQRNKLLSCVTVVASRYASYYPSFKQGQLIQQYYNNNITNISQLNKE